MTHAHAPGGHAHAGHSHGVSADADPRKLAIELWLIVTFICVEVLTGWSHTRLRSSLCRTHAHRRRRDRADRVRLAQRPAKGYDLRPRSHCSPRTRTSAGGRTRRRVAGPRPGPPHYDQSQFLGTGTPSGRPSDRPEYTPIRVQRLVPERRAGLVVRLRPPVRFRRLGMRACRRSSRISTGRSRR